MENDDIQRAIAALFDFQDHNKVAFTSPSPSSTEVAIKNTFSAVLVQLETLATLAR